MNISENLKNLNSWKLAPEKPNKIFREFKFKNFGEALAFVNKISEIAEEMNHHPEIILKWAYVKVTYWTHDLNDLGELDFEAARRVDGLKHTQT
ncbi:MAG: 4a-hydroxytetrahydrobiopterin dehydratase [bacterium]